MLVALIALTATKFGGRDAAHGSLVITSVRHQVTQLWTLDLGTGKTKKLSMPLITPSLGEFCVSKHTLLGWDVGNIVTGDLQAKPTLFKTLTNYHIEGGMAGTSLALSPDGSKAAYLDVPAKEWYQVAHLAPIEAMEGQIMIRDLVTGQVTLLNQKINNDGLAWSPDGAYLVGVTWMPFSKLPARIQPICKRILDKEEYSPQDLDAVPTLIKINLKTGQREIIGIGEQPLFSVDGKNLVSETDYPKPGNIVTDLATGQPQFYPSPENAEGHTIAYFKDGAYLYAATMKGNAMNRPGSKLVFGRYDSNLIFGMDICEGHIGSTRFKTICSVFSEASVPAAFVGDW